MIRTYSNTKAELNIVKSRLELLMKQKEELYTKYFPLTAKLEETSAHTNKKSDQMAEYMAELTKINSITGMSLDQEIEEQRNKVQTIEYYIKSMEYNLKNTTGIENELFKLIVIKGINKSKAVKIIAEKHDMHDDTIWKYHYSKIKKEIDKCIIK